MAMSSVDPLWQFYQKEIQGLKSARTFAIGACSVLQRLFDAVRQDNPRGSAYSIQQFLDSDRLQSSLERALSTFGHLIEPVATPASAPGTCHECRGQDGRRLPTRTHMVKCKSAHEAARCIFIVFGHYFECKVFSRLPQLGSGFKCGDAADALAESHWAEICEELRRVTEFDCAALIAAIEVESSRAFDRCQHDAMKVAAPIETGVTSLRQHAERLATTINGGKEPAAGDGQAGDSVRSKRKPSEEKAYSQYLAAVRNDSRLATATMQKVYKYVADPDNHIVDDGEQLPKAETWERQVRAGNDSGKSLKNAPRAGRSHGGSIAQAEEL